MEKKIMIEGMMCRHCAERVERALCALPGVHAAVDLSGQCAVVSGEAPAEELRRAVENAGYRVTEIR